VRGVFCLLSSLVEGDVGGGGALRMGVDKKTNELNYLTFRAPCVDSPLGNFLPLVRCSTASPLSLRVSFDDLPRCLEQS